MKLSKFVFFVSDENFKKVQCKYNTNVSPLIRNIELESDKIKSSISNSLIRGSFVSSIDKNKDNNSGRTV
jgi:hypothetical protein